MKKLVLFAIAIAAFSVFAFAAISEVKSNLFQAGSAISLENPEDCTIEFYDVTEPVYGTCQRYNDYELCLNTSGPNTQCSMKHDIINYSCETGQKTITKNNTNCEERKKYTINIDKGASTEKKELDFSEWGACKYEEGNGCLIVTCSPHGDGTYKGKFTNCKSGKSCQRFEICDGSIKVLYKNSRNDFVEHDPSFRRPKLQLKEVQK